MAYKMKGSAFYGKGNSSPAKVSDEDVVAAEKSLDEIQHGWKTPGWSKAAKKVFTPGPMDKSKTTEVASDVVKETSKDKQKETPKVKTDHDLEVNKDLMKESPKLDTTAGSGSWGTGGGLGG